MNANPASASGAPALESRALRAPEWDRASVATLDTFDAYRIALDGCRSCAPIATALSASLRDQLLRASSSVVLNIAEGFGSSSRGVKRRHYDIARGSAIECVAILDPASAPGVVSAREVVEARSLFVRTAMDARAAGGTVSV